MKGIYIPNESKQSIGGGWTFMENFKRGITEHYGKEYTIVPKEYRKNAAITLICGVTMVDWKEMREQFGKSKVVLRIDNMPRKSRNKCSPRPHLRMKEAADKADAIVYQSKWARDWLSPFLGNVEKNKIIQNGVDTEIFNDENAENDKNKFLIVHYNRDENKRTPEALDMFTEEWEKNKDAELHIVGRFSEEKIANDFDFYRGEKYTYHGVVDDRKRLASIMKSCGTLLYPSYSDACPNTVIEAVSCGMHIWHRGNSGVGEATMLNGRSIEDMVDDYHWVLSSL